MDAGTEPPGAPARRRARWMLPAVGLIALAGGAAGAYFGLHAARGTGSAAAAAPSPRGDAAAAYDEASHQVVVFGGLGAGGAALNDTWTWDGSTWTEQHPSVSPAARAFALMAYDPHGRDVVMAGGRASQGVGAPIPCTVSGSASAIAAPPVVPVLPGVTEVSPEPASAPASPATPPRQAPRPPPSGSAAPCGGAAVPPLLTDTWTWDGGQWHATGASLPAGLATDTTETAALATDPTTGQVMLLAQTAPEPVPLHACPIPSPGAPPPTCPAPAAPSIRAWTWNGSAWAQLAGSLPTPESVLTVGGVGALVADPATGHLTSFRGGAAVVCAEAPAHNGGSPVPCPLNVASPPAASEPGSPPRGSEAPAPTATAAGVPPAPEPVLPFMQTGSATRWNGRTWSQPQLLPRSPSAFGTSFAEDPAQHSVIAYAGGTTWRWNGSSWTVLQPRHTPGNLAGAVMVYDGTSGRVLLFGGAQVGPGIANPGYVDALWAWDGNDWSQIGRAQPSPTPSPSASPPPAGSPAPTANPGSSPTPAAHPSPSPCVDPTVPPAAAPNRGFASPPASAPPSSVPSCSP